MLAVARPDDREWLRRAAESDEAAWRDEFGVEHDPTGLRSEANVFRYRPLPVIAVRSDGPGRDVLRVLLAAARSGTRVLLSLPPDAAPIDGVDTVRETGETFAARLADLGVERLRLLGDQPEIVLSAAAAAGVSALSAPPVAAGRRELLTVLREQAISRTLQRFGHLPG